MKLSVVSLVGALVLFATSCATAKPLCTHYASPSGSNRTHGSAVRPFATAQRLVDSLRSAETGCLRSGIYRGDLVFPRGGRPGHLITLRGAPGARATIVGRLYIPKHSNFVRVAFLRLDGRNSGNLPSPTVDSAYDQFVHDDVTNDHTAICFEIGSAPPYGAAAHTLIAYDRIHDCGVLPATNHEHGIYVAESAGARIIDNVIYNNADRGIQLYPNAQRTAILGNVIDHNGEGIIISGDHGDASNNNLILNNVISNSTMRANVGSYWPDGNPVGRGNLVAGNCLYGGREPVDRSSGGFVARDNLVIDPRYVNVSLGDYTIAAHNRCALVLADAPFATARDNGLIHGLVHAPIAAP